MSLRGAAVVSRGSISDVFHRSAMLSRLDIGIVAMLSAKVIDILRPSAYLSMGIEFRNFSSALGSIISNDPLQSFISPVRIVAFCTWYEGIIDICLGSPRERESDYR